MTRNLPARGRGRGCDANARDLSAVVGVVIAENLSASEDLSVGGWQRSRSDVRVIRVYMCCRLREAFN